MNPSNGPTTPGIPGRVWKSIEGDGEGGVDVVFTADQLCAMARSRERESIWSRRIFMTLLIGLAGAFAHNIISVGEVWVRLPQGWLLAWTCLLLWRLRQAPRRMSAMESCAEFLRREFEAKRSGLLEIRRYVFLLIPPILALWWGGGGARLSRLRAWGVDPSSSLYKFANGPGPFLIAGMLLVLVWLAFGLAAKKAARELADLRRGIE